MLVTIPRVCYKQCSLYENKHVSKGLVKRELTGCNAACIAKTLIQFEPELKVDESQ